MDSHSDLKRQKDKAHYHRVKNVRWKFFKMRLPPEDFEQLRALAARRRISISELIRTFVVWGMEKR